MKNQQIDTKIIQDKIKLFREIAQANDLNDFQIIKYEQWLSSTLQEVYIKGRESLIEEIKNNAPDCKAVLTCRCHDYLEKLSKRGGKEEGGKL